MAWEFFSMSGVKLGRACHKNTAERLRQVFIQCNGAETFYIECDGTRIDNCKKISDSIWGPHEHPWDENWDPDDSLN